MEGLFQGLFWHLQGAPEPPPTVSQPTSMQSVYSQSTASAENRISAEASRAQSGAAASTSASSSASSDCSRSTAERGSLSLSRQPADPGRICQEAARLGAGAPEAGSICCRHGSSRFRQ